MRVIPSPPHTQGSVFMGFENVEEDLRRLQKYFKEKKAFKSSSETGKRGRGVV